MKKLIILFPTLLIFSVNILLVKPVLAASPFLITGTGQAVSSTSDVSSLTSLALSQAQKAYENNGGLNIPPKAVIVLNNIGNSGNVITSTIRNTYPNSLIVGAHHPEISYTPYTLKEMPADNSLKSLVILIIGGSDITVKHATGVADFASNSNSQAQLGGRDLASKLAPVPNVNNLILLLGPMHSPLNEYVVTGMKQIYGSTLPSNLKVISWAGPYWGGEIFDNGTLRENQIIGIMISGKYKWAATGIDHGNLGWDGTGPEQGDPISAIGSQFEKIKSELGGMPDLSFMAVGHPEQSTLPGIRNMISSKIPGSSLIGSIGGSETGHMSTNMDVKATGSHFFLISLKSELVSPTATPTSNPGKLGDGNNDTRVDGLDYIIWLTNFGTTHTLGASRGDFNSDRKVDGLDYIIWLTNFGK